MLTNQKKKLENKIGKDFFNFLNHSKNYLSASVFNKSLSIITVPIFTRLLIPADYGVLAILDSFISIFAIIYGLGLRGSVGRYYYEKRNDFDQFLGTILIFIIFWALFLSGVLFSFPEWLLKFFQIPKPLLFIGIGIVFFRIFFQVYENYLQASKNSKKVAQLTILQRILTIIISVLIIINMTQDKFYGKAWTMLIVTIGLGGYSLYKLWKLLSINIKLEYIKYALVFSLPVVFHLLSQFVLTAFDRVIINQIVGKAQTGLYSLAYTVGALQSMISMGMLRAWTPEFYGKLNDKKYQDINSLASKFAKLVYLSAFALILFSREMVLILADKQYHEALSIVPIVIISYVFFFLYTMYVNFAFYHKKTHLIALFTIIAGVINIGLNYWLIPIYGYEIAAWTTLISYALLFIMHYLNVKFVIRPEWITKLRVLLPNFVVLIIFTIIFSFISDIKMSLVLLFSIKIIMLAALFLVFNTKKFLIKQNS